MTKRQIITVLFSILICRDVAVGGPGDTWEYLSPSALGLPSDKVLEMYGDSQGHLWVVTKGCGAIGEFDGENWELHDVGFCASDFASMTGNTSGMWLAGDRLWRYHSDTWTTWEGSVTSVLESTAERTTKSIGEECWSPNVVSVTPEIYEGVPYISAAEITDIELDEFGTLWVGSNGLGDDPQRMFSFDGEEVSCWQDELISHRYPNQLILSPEGHLWIRILGKLVTFQEEQWIDESTPGFVRRLAPGSNKVWAFVDPFLLLKYEQAQWLQVLEIEESFGDIIALTDDSKDGAWMAFGNTNEQGILHFQNGMLMQYAFPSESEITAQTFLFTQLLVHNNRIWFGYQDGLYYLKDRQSAVTPNTWGIIKATH